ncbi:MULTISPECIES: DUF484 family protein [Giesbergeria]|uniref:DUF484 family protein n=1 Tax=Giesbergeria sinuosa TaxID=80883 RepID=A0ABV9QGN1_9BURK
MTAHDPTPFMAPITEEDIADYLMETPGFFERHAELLTNVQIISPHGHRAVSLQERQAERLRAKIADLEQRILDMVHNGQQNMSIDQRLHQWACDLQRVTHPPSLPEMVVQGIRRQFEVPQAAMRIWGVSQAYANAPFAMGASHDVRAFASSLTMPFCGPNLGFEPVGWLRDGDMVQSLALLPLRDGPMEHATPAFGLLVLASEDPHRFEATMGTDFLTRIAETASAALARLR